MSIECSNCPHENLRDYPVCVNCETKVHFTHREDCRCVRLECRARLNVKIADAMFKRDLARTLQIAIGRNAELQEPMRRVVAHFSQQVDSVTPDNWCESCFSDGCKHVVSTY